MEALSSLRLYTLLARLVRLEFDLLEKSVSYVESKCMG